MSLNRWQLHSRVTAFTTTRLGGYSQGEYSEFNINPWVDDDSEAIRRNRQLLCQILQLPDVSHIILPHQVHCIECFQLRRDYFDMTEDAQKQALEGIDIVLTDLPGVCIGISTADCVPILLYDSVHHAACAIHAGWRGCVQGAIPKGIQAMQEAYSTQPKNLHALIGPHISAERYPVGAEVLDEFIRAGFDVKPLITPHPSPSGPRWNLDLRTFCLYELQRAGIHPDSIVNILQCTYNLSDLYFSARRQGIACGRNYTGVILES